MKTSPVRVQSGNFTVVQGASAKVYAPLKPYGTGAQGCAGRLGWAEFHSKDPAFTVMPFHPHIWFVNCECRMGVSDSLRSHTPTTQNSKGESASEASTLS